MTVRAEGDGIDDVPATLDRRGGSGQGGVIFIVAARCDEQQANQAKNGIHEMLQGIRVKARPGRPRGTAIA